METEFLVCLTPSMLPALHLLLVFDLRPFLLSSFLLPSLPPPLHPAHPPPSLFLPWCHLASTVCFRPFLPLSLLLSEWSTAEASNPRNKEFLSNFNQWGGLEAWGYLRLRSTFCCEPRSQCLPDKRQTATHLWPSKSSVFIQERKSDPEKGEAFPVLQLSWATFPDCQSEQGDANWRGSPPVCNGFLESGPERSQRRIFFSLIKELESRIKTSNWRQQSWLN